jgi:hypothetical protein
MEAGSIERRLEALDSTTAETLLPLALILMIAVGVTCSFGPILVYYYSYRRTKVSRCKKALKQTLKHLTRARRDKLKEKATQESKLASLNQQMLAAVVQSAFRKLPISEVTAAKGIGDNAARSLRQCGFTTVADLRHAMRRIGGIDGIEGIGPQRQVSLREWVFKTENQLRRRAKTDPHFEAGTRDRYEDQLAALRRSVADLEESCTVLRRASELVSDELQGYQQIGFAGYVRGKLSAQQGHLETPVDKPAAFDARRGPDCVERQRLPDDVVETFRFERTLRQHLETNFREMTPREFEEFVALLFGRLGYTGVRLTPLTQDFGADIECTDHEGRPTIVEVKRHNAGNRIGNEEVRGLAGARDHFGANFAYLYLHRK